ncbi:PTS mannose/fructose/sorbose/N-acetylgalactosamine transporter subunit IIC [Aerococcus sanguinicola]|uniref:PTS mannose/fructose/sorbose/N-acetylgalactosamine transporter subunit IIC n=1 Tax=unclassified Aerococcus TaxID=2618060 RepID=UPI0008A4F958|nr:MULTISPECIES: PTS sugar transporter subunit IIC [unclassified Aerococcus]KAB0647368.1 PTS sugar transporter subunit IIC [Aerococcus sanguinicola]MDK6233168.1 PTS sugar transporter subunit IIC [Aerococcus sp. UMB10185]MDK6804707.1 PTS sugar transporter subunit IIC [Aerococcus sp. UMB7834]MDK6856005.1 PTS sugar transporter subunit IIC [Aerococcus sp. UMB7533]MDK8502400.1 PTS sugar transporter subunit IIC [Aerococcus sp. UMB1112A]
MAIQWWQILLLTLYSGYQIWDELHLVTSAGSAVFAGLFTGLVMGDVKTGLIIGGAMQLTILGVGTFGGASRIDANSGTVLATAFSVAIGMEPEQAVAALAVPVAALMIQTDVLARFANTYFAHRIDSAIEKHDYKGIERNYLMGILPWALSRMIPIFLALAFGGGVVQTAVDYLNTNLAWLADGLTLAGRVLPAVGFAILLRYLPVKKNIAYLALGFVITALLSTVFSNITAISGELGKLAEELSGTFVPLPMLGVSLIGFALAFIHYKNTVERQALEDKLAKAPAAGAVNEGSADSAVEGNPVEEGEILDDEL